MDANSILQSYNKATGSSSTPQYKPTGKPKVDSILSSYYSASAKTKAKPTVTPAPKKVAATPIVKQAPQTGVQKALKTLGDVSQQAQNVVKTIGKGIELTFVKPKIISPVPEKTQPPAGQQQRLQAQPQIKPPVVIKPNQTKLNKDQLSTIIGPAQTQLIQGKKQTIWDKIGSFIGEQFDSTKSQQARAMNAMAVKKTHPEIKASLSQLSQKGGNIMKNSAMENVTKQLGIRKGGTASEAVSTVFTAAIALGLAEAPVSTAVGIGVFSAINEVKSGLISAIKGKGFKLGANQTLGDLFENAPPDVKNVLDIVDFLATAKATHSVFKASPRAFEILTKDTIEKYNMPKVVNLTPADIKKINLGKTGAEADLVKSLGLSSSAWRKAVKEGITIEVQSEKLTNIVDKPYWKKIKSMLGKEPTNIETKVTGGTTARPGFAGYLTDGQHTPQEVVGAVIKAGEEKTVEGKATIKAALEAQKSGHNIEIKQVKENKKDPYVYHETKDSNLESIAKNGLQKSPGQYGNAVYTAGTIAETKGYGSEGDTILRIKRDNLPSDFQEFPEQGWTTKTIPPQYLEVSKDNGKTWQFLQEQTIPQIERAKDYTSAKDFATEVYSAQPSNQIGLVDPKTIEIRDNVDPTSAEYKKLKSDIEKNGIKEPIRVTVDDKPLTTDGSNRTAIARELGIKVPVIVNSGEIKGLSTIEGIYKEKYPKTEITDKVLKENKIISVPAIGTPKLAQGVRNNAIKNKIIYGFDKTFRDLPEYDRVDVKDQGNKAVELVLSDPNRAFRIAMGQEHPPSNLLPESVFVALENYATETKNIDVLRQLATQSDLTMQATGMGQRLRMLAERNPDSAVKIMSDIVKVKDKVITKKYNGRTMSDIVKTKTNRGAKMVENTKSEHINKDDWSSLIDEVLCK